MAQQPHPTCTAHQSRKGCVRNVVVSVDRFRIVGKAPIEITVGHNQTSSEATERHEPFRIREPKLRGTGPHPLLIVQEALSSPGCVLAIECPSVSSAFEEESCFSVAASDACSCAEDKRAIGALNRSAAPRIPTWRRIVIPSLSSGILTESQQLQRSQRTTRSVR